MADVAERHGRTLDGRSYVWENEECREFVRNESVVDADCSTDVLTYGNETTYRWIQDASPDSRGETEFGSATSEDRYANGTTEFRRVRIAERAWYGRERATPSGEEFTFGIERFVQLYLSVNDSTVRRVERDGEHGFRVVGTGHHLPSYDRAQEYRVVAFVDEDGLVTDLRARYSRSYGNTTVRTTVRSEFRDVDDATVDPPSWLDAARENVSAPA